jgi:hypothetical protein
MLETGDTNKLFDIGDIYRLFYTRNTYRLFELGENLRLFGRKIISYFFPGDTYSLLGIGDI